MAKHYDNIEDVKSKLASTMIYYDGVPTVVKACLVEEDDPNKFKIQITTKGFMSRTYAIVSIEDPKLNWSKFNIGYANIEQGAVWWFRKPVRQYRQGLKGDQMHYIASDRTPDFGYSFTAGPPVESMLLNDYPPIGNIEPVLKDGIRTVMAFHKDFALSWDKIHRDMIVEHKGRLIGCMSKNFKDVSLADDSLHLTETLKEILSVR